MTTNEPNQSLLRLPEVTKRTGLSRSTIYAYIERKEFPKPVKIGLRAVAWLETDINTWILERTKFVKTEA